MLKNNEDINGVYNDTKMANPDIEASHQSSFGKAFMKNYNVNTQLINLQMKKIFPVNKIFSERYKRSTNYIFTGLKISVGVLITILVGIFLTTLCIWRYFTVFSFLH